MTWEHLLYLGVFFAAAVYFSGVFTFRKASGPLSAHDFFHWSNTGLNIISLFVASTTVASGIGYLLIGGQTNGLLMLLVPITTFIGYRLLVRFMVAVSASELSQYPSFWAGAQAMTEHAIGRGSILRHVLIAPLALIFVLFCAFELLVSSQIIEAIMLGRSGVGWQIAIAGAMLASTLYLTIRGGVYAVFRTDVIQFVGIMLFGLIFGTAAWLSSRTAGQASHLLIKFDHQTLLNVFLASLGGITTQFYSSLNHYTVSNAKDNRQLRRVLTGGALLIGAFSTLMILIGAGAVADWSQGLSTGIASLLSHVTTGTIMTPVLLVIVVVGLACVTMSTLDSLMISVTMQVFDGILGGNSRDGRNDAATVHRIRRLLFWMFGVVILLCAPAFYLKPSVFFTLLAIASGAEVLVPLIVLIGLFARQPKRLSILSNKALAVYALLFVSTLTINLTASSIDPTIVPFVSLVHSSLSVVYSIILWRRSYLRLRV